MISETPQNITLTNLVALDDFTGTHPLKVDLVYAQAAHPDNMFKTAIYRPDAKMWGHRDMVAVILKAAQICHERSGWIFEVKDCLRTVEAQALMQQSEIVRQNPQWLTEEPRLLSPPGKGGHPRGMAVDVILLDENGAEIDMGTKFDYLTKDRANNPAARAYTKFTPAVLQHRRLLEESMMEAALDFGRELLPLPQEWWDFRFLPEYTNRFAPIRDADLPEVMRMTGV
jgi:D-alanyl-D-alanine dipeptidase